MIKSMTGYGAGVALGDFYRVTVEIKSVNHRYLEIFLRLPRSLNVLEDQVKKQLQSFLQRGKVDLNLSLEQIGTKKPNLLLDNELAIAYHNSLVQLAALCDLKQEFCAETLAAFPGVLTPEKAEDDLDEISVLVEQATTEALQQLLEMRKCEGAALAEDLRQRFTEVEQLAQQITEHLPEQALEQQQKLQKRVEELLGDIAVDEARFANEIAFLADKSDISEELTRLNSHLAQALNMLHEQEPVGRRLDFILQELNREINTIGSKSNALVISNTVIDAKSRLEKIREQVQNIE